MKLFIHGGFTPAENPDERDLYITPQQTMVRYGLTMSDDITLVDRRDRKSCLITGFNVLHLYPLPTAECKPHLVKAMVTKNLSFKDLK